MSQRRPIPYRLIPGCRGASREQSREHQGFRSRLVADASGAPVLRGQGPIGRPGTARPIADLEHRELGKHCRPVRQMAGLTARPFLRARGGHAGLLVSRPGADAVVWRCSDQASFVPEATLPDGSQHDGTKPPQMYR
jgi:hypothetical protein